MTGRNLHRRLIDHVDVLDGHVKQLCLRIAIKPGRSRIGKDNPAAVRLNEEHGGTMVFNRRMEMLTVQPGFLNQPGTLHQHGQLIDVELSIIGGLVGHADCSDYSTVVAYRDRRKRPDRDMSLRIAFF